MSKNQREILKEKNVKKIWTLRGLKGTSLLVRLLYINAKIFSVSADVGLKGKCNSNMHILLNFPPEASKRLRCTSLSQWVEFYFRLNQSLSQHILTVIQSKL